MNLNVYVYIAAMALVGASGPFLKEMNINFRPDQMHLSKVVILGLVVVLNVVSVLISIRIKEKE